MTDLAAKYQIPAEIMAFVNDGFLELVAETEATKTVEFHIPSMRSIDRHGRITCFSITWIHPDFNAEFCHYYDQKPGDLPNFFAEEDTSDIGNDLIDGLESVDDLAFWLDEMRETIADGFPATNR